MTGTGDAPAERARAGLPRPLVAFAVALPAAFLVLVAPEAWIAVQRGRQKRTMGDIRSLATALESHSIDHEGYPMTPGVVAASSLAGSLEPTYVRQLRARDGWGGDLLVESSGAEYTIVSHARDRRPDGPDTVRLPNGGTTGFEDDIVFSTGSFVQFPASY